MINVNDIEVSVSRSVFKSDPAVKIVGTSSVGDACWYFCSPLLKKSPYKYKAVRLDQKNVRKIGVRDVDHDTSSLRICRMDLRICSIEHYHFIWEGSTYPRPAYAQVFPL